MSNHFSAANLKHPGDDARLDLTDLFVFAAPDDPDRTVLIMDANPFTKGDGFHPDAVYRFNIDNDGDALADVAFSFTFSEPHDGRQTASQVFPRRRRTRNVAGTDLTAITKSVGPGAHAGDRIGRSDAPSYLPRTTSAEVVPSVTSTGTSLVEGELAIGQALRVVAETEGLVAFGDGIEADRLTLGWGQEIQVRLASRSLRLALLK